MRFVFIDAEKAMWPVTVMCLVLKVSTSGYYAWRKRPESAHGREDVRIGVLVEEAHVRSRATYGSPRVHEVLRSKGLRVSRKRIIRLMKALGLRGRKPRAFVRTTESVPGAEAAPDLIGRDFTAVAPNLKWVGDVTYLRTPEGWIYLAVLLDLYSRRVVGWALSPVNDRKLALRALQAAILVRQPAPGWIHHTDRGSPYLSEDYQKALEAAKARPRNSRRGNCLDNAAIESWNATLRRGRRRRRKRAGLACGETRRQGARRTRPGAEPGDKPGVSLLGEVFESFGHAQRSLFEWIEVFDHSGSRNRDRIHSANGHRSPAKYERAGVA